MDTNTGEVRSFFRWSNDSLAVPQTTWGLVFLSHFLSFCFLTNTVEHNGRSVDSNRVEHRVSSIRPWGLLSSDNQCLVSSDDGSADFFLCIHCRSYNRVHFLSNFSWLLLLFPLQAVLQQHILFFASSSSSFSPYVSWNSCLYRILPL